VFLTLLCLGAFALMYCRLTPKIAHKNCSWNKSEKTEIAQRQYTENYPYYFDYHYYRYSYYLKKWPIIEYTATKEKNWFTFADGEGSVGMTVAYLARVNSAVLQRQIANYQRLNLSVFAAHLITATHSMSAPQNSGWKHQWLCPPRLKNNDLANQFWRQKSF